MAQVQVRRQQKKVLHYNERTGDPTHSNSWCRRVPSLRLQTADNSHCRWHYIRIAFCSASNILNFMVVYDSVQVKHTNNVAACICTFIGWFKWLSCDALIQTTWTMTIVNRPISDSFMKEKLCDWSIFWLFSGSMQHCWWMKMVLHCYLTWHA